jgi:hypothetical protein
VGRSFFCFGVVVDFAGHFAGFGRFSTWPEEQAADFERRAAHEFDRIFFPGVLIPFQIASAALSGCLIIWPQPSMSWPVFE